MSQNPERVCGSSDKRGRKDYHQRQEVVFFLLWFNGLILKTKTSGMIALNSEVKFCIC